jgi:oxygen-independent coproporphyrinogen-3 oxidase
MTLLAPYSPRLTPDRLANVVVPGLYVHIPFCFHKCHYCDFYSITRQTDDRMHRFVDLLLAEARQWATRAGESDGEAGITGRSMPGPTSPDATARCPAARFATARVATAQDATGSGLTTRAPTIRPKSIFFGGGTPSLLPLTAMRKLLAGLAGSFDLSELDEWTVECNPATVRPEYCDALRAGGVNRISMGAQSFSRDELAALERHHDPDDVFKSLQIARAAGFDRLNIDLIYGIPGQSLADWSANLESAIALGTSHLSCYGLTYEPNTPIAVKKRLGLVRAVDEDLELSMLHHTRARLAAAGMPAYEISNYAAVGQECRHNLLYWTGGDYIGLGPSAASHVQGWRWRNRPHLGEWEQSVAAGELPAIELETLSPDRRAAELAMLTLRLSAGVDYADFNARAGYDAAKTFGPVIDRLSKAGLLETSDAGFKLSPTGLNVADAISAEFLNAD